MAPVTPSTVHSVYVLKWSCVCFLSSYIYSRFHDVVYFYVLFCFFCFSSTMKITLFLWSKKTTSLEVYMTQTMESFQSNLVPITRHVTS